MHVSSFSLIFREIIITTLSAKIALASIDPLGIST